MPGFKDWAEASKTQNKVTASDTSSMGPRKSATAGNAAQDPAVVDAVLRRLRSKKVNKPQAGMNNPFKPVK